MKVTLSSIGAQVVYMQESLYLKAAALMDPELSANKENPLNLHLANFRGSLLAQCRWGDTPQLERSLKTRGCWRIAVASFHLRRWPCTLLLFEQPSGRPFQPM